MSSLFGLNESNRLVHVSEVGRGLACHCRCVGCGEALIARQGEKREHHFAHASNKAPCESSHESLLHLYAKQLIADALGLVVPMTQAIASYLQIKETSESMLLHAILPVHAEVSIGNIRPDILLLTTDGVQVAVEVAYSSFCDEIKIAEFEKHGLPALEIDLSQFTPDNFDPVDVKEAVIQSVQNKKWIWPVSTSEEMAEANPQPFLPSDCEVVIDPVPTSAPTSKSHWPEEIIVFSGRWVSVKTLPSGDIAVKVVRYDPDLVSLIRSVCKPHGGRYSTTYQNWIVPRWAAKTVRQKLHNRANTTEIRMEVIRGS
jgi:hypothetical protein